MRVVHCDPNSLPETARREAVKWPVLLIIGEVAALGRTLAWIGGVCGPSRRAHPA